ncbi:MAG: LPS export ABC transporter periplasmic protein LptC [Acidobacteria bacterium RIFCSPLOWO2_12_FULL_65_11]|nr:MAG: LPS export ABC transporter periplasmic protein LptC [Acidobacteria bacterium RIFCSPLOWO2_02_FULL_64_15]OFW34215.1 MAG: LPS export ABC transporter periplasmic protein LptC [Acidobacteria bacterium RIFCSPLOWO2_12_FULL_65_11]
MRWQRVARLLIVIASVAFTVVVVLAFKRRDLRPTASPPVRTDPAAVAESTSGRVARFKLSREDVSVEYEKQLTYADGSTRLVGVTIVTEERGGGRRFTITGKEGRVGQNDATMTLDGDVRLASSDGVVVRTEHASYTDTDGVVSTDGPVEFSRGRTAGSGVGLTYDHRRDVLTILDQVVTEVAPDESGAGGTHVTSETAAFARGERSLRFTGGARLQRERQIVESETAVVILSTDEKRIETMSLRNGSRVAAGQSGAGGLQALTGRDMDLKYASDGRTIEHAFVAGDGVIQLAGESGRAGRQIAAGALDISLAPDGTTPVALAARGAVQLTLPAESGTPARTIRSATMDGTGEPDRGLTQAQFAGGVEYRERGPDVDRVASAGTLDVTFKPGMSAIEEVRFARSVRFVDGQMTALAHSARYDLDKSLLELTGSEPGALAPRVVNELLAVDATRIDVVLVGPTMTAAGAVRSVLQPIRRDSRAEATSDRRLPSMFSQDEPINVTAGALDYDGSVSKATYSGGAQLWQGERSIKATSIVLDARSGDLAATGTVVTATVLDEVDKEKKRTRVRSIATAREFTYEDASRRATYAGDAHLSASDRDLRAARIELYLKPSGDELERAEAYDAVTLRDQNRRITGARLTHTTSDDRYFVAGQPVTITDACGGATTGRTLTYLKAADTLVVDGSQQSRTQTRGRGQCP